MSGLIYLLNDDLKLLPRAHRPRRLHLRGKAEWQEVVPHLDEVGIDVSVRRVLPQVTAAFEDYLSHLRESRRSGMVKPSASQQTVETLFPAVAKWVQGYGHIEIGEQESFGFVPWCEDKLEDTTYICRSDEFIIRVTFAEPSG